MTTSSFEIEDLVYVYLVLQWTFYNENNSY